MLFLLCLLSSAHAWCNCPGQLIQGPDGLYKSSQGCDDTDALEMCLNVAPTIHWWDSQLARLPDIYHRTLPNQCFSEPRQHTYFMVICQRYVKSIDYDSYSTNMTTYLQAQWKKLPLPNCRSAYTQTPINASVSPLICSNSQLLRECQAFKRAYSQMLNSLNISQIQNLLYLPLLCQSHDSAFVYDNNSNCHNSAFLDERAQGLDRDCVGVVFIYSVFACFLFLIICFGVLILIERNCQSKPVPVPMPAIALKKMRKPRNKSSRKEACIESDISDDNEACVYCAGSLNQGQVVILPACGHTYHQACYAPNSNEPCRICKKG